MTEQEALELGKKLSDNVINGKNNIIEVRDYVEFVGVATESLEKQIAKKPVRYTGGFKCPSCNYDGIIYLESDGTDKYCCDCGQKLDWGDEDAVD